VYDGVLLNHVLLTPCATVSLVCLHALVMQQVLEGVNGGMSVWVCVRVCVCVSDGVSVCVTVCVSDGVCVCVLRLILVFLSSYFLSSYCVFYFYFFSLYFSFGFVCPFWVFVNNLCSCCGMLLLFLCSFFYLFCYVFRMSLFPVLPW